MEVFIGRSCIAYFKSQTQTSLNELRGVQRGARVSVEKQMLPVKSV